MNDTSDTPAIDNFSLWRNSSTEIELECTGCWKPWKLAPDSPHYLLCPKCRRLKYVADGLFKSRRKHLAPLP